MVDYERERVFGVVVLSRTPMSLEEGLYRNRGRLLTIGVGLLLAISDANAERVFEQFFTTDREGGGTGLGLPIVRRLCQAHGGDIELIREPGLTVFEVRLPSVAEEVK